MLLLSYIVILFLDKMADNQYCCRYRGLSLRLARVLNGIYLLVDYITMLGLLCENSYTSFRHKPETQEFARALRNSRVSFMSE